jgi:hypothetical protein
LIESGGGEFPLEGALRKSKIGVARNRHCPFTLIKRDGVIARPEPRKTDHLHFGRQIVARRQHSDFTDRKAWHVHDAIV